MWMTKVYKGSFTKDHLPMALIVGGTGALLVIVPLAVFYLWITNVTSEGTKFEDIALNVTFFIALFLAFSVLCFYLVWRGTHERVTVDGMGMSYYATFFDKSIPALGIEKVMIFDKERPVIIYNYGDELRQMKLPVWKSNDYIDNLVADLKPVNPNIDVVDLRKEAGVGVVYEPAGEAAAAAVEEKDR
jgi:hypothetical protein